MNTGLLTPFGINAFSSSLNILQLRKNKSLQSVLYKMKSINIVPIALKCDPEKLGVVVNACNFGTLGG